MSKKKLFIIPIVLLLCLALLVAASFAWINLSRTPEISGINTQVGANGNLEIALLNDNTYMYPYEIGTGVGSSAAATTVQQSNMTWGNVVDLSDESYGLHDVSLLPSRLNLKSYDEGRGVVSGNMLMVPTYSVDGRILNFYSDTVSAIYRGNEFLYDYEQHGYGVRGIGSIMEITPQQAALTNARSLVNSYESAAAGAVTSLWNANGVQIFDIVYRADNVNKTDAVFTKADLAILRDTATRTYGALSYVDSALRQGVVGCLAIDEQSHSTFKSLRDEILDGQKLLSDVIANKLSEAYKDDDHMEWDDLYSWSVEVESDKALMKSVMVECDNLTASGEAFTWEQISPIYNKVLNTEYVCFNGDISISNYLDNVYVNSDNIMDLWSDNDLILINGAGPLYNISKYAGKYSVLLSYTSENVIEVSTLENWYTHLEEISEDLKNVYAVGGGSVISAPLEDVYGYAIDLAFRTNAKSNLMLQTDPEMIVDAEGEATQIEGNGSYMSFSSKYLNEEQVVTMMDAVRVGFLDNRNILIGLAKLNTSNYTEEDGTVRASLYMYEYRLSSDGSISMGERRSEDSTIMSLEKATPTILTAVVWLDGDHTDNSIASSLGYSLTGKLNLQFASDAELKPAGSEVVGGDSSEETTVPEDTTMPEDTTTPEEPEDPDAIPDRPEGNGEIVASGEVSDTMSWAYHSNGCLEITGTGDMLDYDTFEKQPWGDYRRSIKSIKVSDGITSFGSYSFGSCSCDVVEIPESVVSIAMPNFVYSSRPYVYYGGSEQKWNALGLVDRAAWNYGEVSYGKSDASLYKSGSVGGNISWELYNDGVLKVSGTGAMPDFSETTKPSWMDYSDKIKYVYIAEGIENVGNYAFANCSAIETAKISATVKVLGDYSFNKCQSLKAVVILDGSKLETVGIYAFGNCVSLIHTNMGMAADTIGSYAFVDCAALKYINLHGVTKMGEAALHCCYSLEKVEIPFGVSRIEFATFARCFALKEVTIPVSVTEIDHQAFVGAEDENGESNLDIYYDGSVDMWNNNVNGNLYLSSFNVICSDSVVASGSVNSTVYWMLNDTGYLYIYGEGAMNDYPDDMFSKPWGDYLYDIQYIEIEDGITSIEANAFSYTSAYRISIPKSVEYISWSAVNECDYLETISYAGTLAEYDAIVTDGTPPDVDVYTN